MQVYNVNLFTLIVLAITVCLGMQDRASAHDGDHAHEIHVWNNDQPAVDTSNSAEPIWAVAAIFGFAFATVVVRTLRSKRSVAVAATLLAVCSAGVLAVAQESKPKPTIQTHFEPFKETLKFRSDEKYFYVESTGLPDHQMMVGIKSWQQQVPMSQAYTGRNAWQIPLVPKMAEKPISAKKALYRGAIALAANGVPIFNALNNRGEDAYLAGELDEFGGHCGRGDDYHYHTAPVHLEKTVGKGNPIGYALDGFPLYGYLDAKGKEPTDLDEFNGREEADGYRYYSTKKYPYINGGLRGVVTVKGDQIDPQPRASSPRPPLQPLRGAKITDFDRDEKQKSMTLKYDLSGQSHSVQYTLNNDGSYTFIFTNASGKETTETYRSRRPEGKDDRPPPKKDSRF